jgi:HK97 family phage major capsid protein
VGSKPFAGFPVVIDNNIPAHGSGVASVVIGEFSRFPVHDAGLRFERSDQRYFDSNQVGFRAIWRLDGKVLDGNAFAKYVANAN